MFFSTQLKYYKKLNKALVQCFYTESEDFYRMLDILSIPLEKQNPTCIEKHHLIPRSYFKIKNQQVIHDGNLFKLSYTNHIWVHYYAWCCAKPLIKDQMLEALFLMVSCNFHSKEEVEALLKQSDFLEKLEKIRKECVKKRTKYKTERERKEACKRNRKKYNQSKKGKEHKAKDDKKYQQSEKGKKAIQRYQLSEKGKIARQKYTHSEKFKIANKRYRQSEKGKEGIKRRSKLPQYKEIHERANIKYRQKLKAKVLFEGRELQLSTLIEKLRLRGIENPTAEARKYLITKES